MLIPHSLEQVWTIIRSRKSAYAGNSPTYDWQKQLINNNAPLQDHNVRVSGGNESTTYYFSAGYSKTESPLKSNYLERFSVAAM